MVRRPIHPKAGHLTGDLLHAVGPSGIRQKVHLQGVRHDALDRLPPRRRVPCAAGHLVVAQRPRLHVRPARTGEDVGRADLECAQRDQPDRADHERGRENDAPHRRGAGRHAGCRHAVHKVAVAPGARESAGPRFRDQDGDDRHRHQRPCRHLARQREAEREPGDHDVARAPPRHNARQPVEGQRDERDHGAVDREEVGLLDMERRERDERGRDQPDPPIVDPRAEQEDDDDGHQVEGRTHPPADQMDVAVADHPNPFADPPGQRDRERAITEKVVVAIPGIERGCIGIEIAQPIRGNLDRGRDHGEEALVRMEVVAGVPIGADKAQGGAGGKDAEEEEDGDGGAGHRDTPRTGRAPRCRGARWRGPGRRGRRRIGLEVHRAPATAGFRARIAVIRKLRSGEGG